MLVNSVSTNTFIDVLPAKRTFEMRLGDEIDKGIGKKTLIWALDYAAANDLNGRRHSQNHRQAVVEILSDCGEGN